MNKYTIHAEKDCIMNYGKKKKLKNYKMLIVKIINNEPVVFTSCEMCQKLTKKYNITLIRK
jgi:hypothetical protein